MERQVPTLTQEMRQAALEKAMANRRKIAQVKQDLRDGKVSFQDVIAMRDDEAIGRMKVISLIQTLPRVGSMRAESIMNEIQIAPSRRVRGVGSRQLEKLLAIEEKYRSSDES